VSRLSRLPIRWRLAVTSAALTFLILAAFGIVIGLFTARQVREDFDDELRATVADLQNRIGVREFGGAVHLTARTDVIQAAAAGDAELRVITPAGRTVLQTRGAAHLGTPLDPLHDAGAYRVASRPIFAQDQPAAFVQYAKPRKSVNATIARINLFLAAGVFGGALLALLAGLAVARRAMDPVAQLTRAAREIARTRDPDVTLPKPASEDEVAELARTLDDMLRELNAARTELESMLSRQREFVADASHELRTPLTSILANLELLDAALQGEDAEVVQSALRSSLRMRGLVSDLLMLARADAQHERPREPVDVGDTVRAAAGEAAALAAAHDLSVDAPDGLIVEGWRDDLHRLALNLIENALRHTPPGTAVLATARREGDAIVVVVEDEGPGLPPGIRERVFERFVRGAGDGGRGSGLGLAIVEAVATAHGGEVSYERGDGGGGAKFVVRLPNSQLPTPNPANQTSTTTGSTIGRRLSRS
jgi:two-component system OmpR family sensor kinase